MYGKLNALAKAITEQLLISGIPDDLNPPSFIIAFIMYLVGDYLKFLNEVLIRLLALKQSAMNPLISVADQRLVDTAIENGIHLRNEL